MTRHAKWRMLRWLCLCGLIASLLAWMLPVRMKPYHIKRFLDDWTRDFMVEQVSEWGMDADGLVKVRYSRQFSGGTRAAVDQIRQHWHKDIEKSRQRWPTDGKRLHYDEWGPSNWDRSDGVHVIEVGAVYCLPYTFIALVCAMPLLGWIALEIFRRARGH